MDWARGQEWKAFHQRKRIAIKSAQKCLTDNLGYVTQSIEQISKNNPPTFSLDTVPLAALFSDSGRFLAESVAADTNKLRFELEHINNKLFILRDFFLTLHIFTTTLPAQNQADTLRANSQIYHSLRVDTCNHLTSAQAWISSLGTALEAEALTTKPREEIPYLRWFLRLWNDA